MNIQNVRSISLGSRKRKFTFTPTSSGKISIHILEAGADTDYNVSIVNTDKGVVKKGGVVLDVTAGTRCNLDVELDQEFSGAVKVVAYEI